MFGKMDNFQNSIAYGNDTIVRAEQTFLSKVYAWMVGGLLITGLTAWIVFNSGLYIDIINNSILFFILIIAEVALVFSISSRIERLSNSTAGLMFALYSFLNGLTLSVIFAAFTAVSIQNVFLISAGMFAALSFYGYVTKRNLSGFGSFLYMGLIGLFIAIIINLFIGGSALNFLISVIGVLIFSGLTVYDTQKIKEFYAFELEGNEQLAGKAAIKGALILYLDFINLFMFMLRLFGNRD